MSRLVAFVAALGVVAGCAAPDAAPPVLGSVPEFRLTDRDGAAFGSTELAGAPWVAGFIFTRCPDVCPAVMAQMKRVQDGFDGADVDARLVSFSVDPAHDTPERLGDYGARFGAAANWHLLTGDRAEIAHLVVKGFKLAFADDGPVENPITHSDRLVLVDGARQIRGYYHGRLEGEVDRLVVDAVRLARDRG